MKIDSKEYYKNKDRMNGIFSIRWKHKFIITGDEILELMKSLENKIVISRESKMIAKTGRGGMWIWIREQNNVKIW